MALAASCSAFAKTFDWPLNAPVAKAETFTAYHGETVRFNLVLSGAMSNVTAEAIYYQTNGMAKSDWFGPIPGTVFHPTNDCGAAAYRFFIRCSDPDGNNYTPNGTLRLLDSPGFEPSTVQLPVKTLDFAAVSVANPPWEDGIATNAADIAALAAKTNSYLTAAAISTNNAAFCAAVRDVPLTGADADDMAEIAEYGGYGTVGAAILALIAGLAALSRRMGNAESALAGKLNVNGPELTSNLKFDLGGSVYGLEFVDSEESRYFLECNGRTGEVYFLSGSAKVTVPLDRSGTLALRSDVVGNYVAKTGDTMSGELALPLLKIVSALNPTGIRLSTVGARTLVVGAPGYGTIAFPLVPVSGNVTLATLSDIAQVRTELRYLMFESWDGLDATGSNTVAKLVVTSPTAVLNAYAPALDSGGRVYDFYADVVNEYGANAEIELGGLGSDWEAVVRDGESLSQMTTLAPGEMARFHFTKTAFVRNGRPVFLVTKTVLVEPSSGGGTYQLETDGTVSTEGELNSDGTLTVEGEPNSDGTLTVEAL